MKKEVKEAINTITSAFANCAEGDRHIVVLDRGWIFAGNLSCDEHNVYTLSSAVNVRKWNKGGFGALTSSVSAAEATLDKCSSIRFHQSAMIFVVPIGDDWDK
jgi:hypothetical protein